jgi:hypothetical protein
MPTVVPRLAVRGTCLVTLRKDLPAAEVEALHERLNRALDGVGVDTQPKVAQRLVELSQNPDAQIKD